MTLEKYSMELKKLGQLIKTKRVEATKTPSDMGAALKISGRQFQRYESKGNFTVHQLLVIRDVIGYDIFRHMAKGENSLTALKKIESIVGGVKGNAVTINSMLREILELLRDYEGIIGISSDEQEPFSKGTPLEGKQPMNHKKDIPKR